MSYSNTQTGSTNQPVSITMFKGRLTLIRRNERYYAATEQKWTIKKRGYSVMLGLLCEPSVKIHQNATDNVMHFLQQTKAAAIKCAWFTGDVDLIVVKKCGASKNMGLNLRNFGCQTNFKLAHADVVEDKKSIICLDPPPNKMQALLINV